MPKMPKIVAENGPYKVYRVAPKVLAVYRGERFQCNLRPADADYRDPAGRIARAIACEAQAKAIRADFVAYGRARKAGFVVANAAAAYAEPMLF